MLAVADPFADFPVAVMVICLNLPSGVAVQLIASPEAATPGEAGIGSIFVQTSLIAPLSLIAPSGAGATVAVGGAIVTGAGAGAIVTGGGVGAGC
jgi:hypothetical protein